MFQHHQDSIHNVIKKMKENDNVLSPTFVMKANLIRQVPYQPLNFVLPDSADKPDPANFLRLLRKF